MDELITQEKLDRAALDTVVEFLEAQSAEKALIAALPAALSVGAQERNEFDKLTVEEALKQISSMRQRTEMTIREGAANAAFAEAEALGAWAILDVEQDAVRAADSAVMEAQAAVSHAESERSAAKTSVEDHRKALSSALVQEALAEDQTKLAADAAVMEAQAAVS